MAYATFCTKTFTIIFTLIPSLCVFVTEVEATISIPETGSQYESLPASFGINFNTGNNPHAAILQLPPDENDPYLCGKMEEDSGKTKTKRSDFMIVPPNDTILRDDASSEQAKYRPGRQVKGNRHHKLNENKYQNELNGGKDDIYSTEKYEEERIQLVAVLVKRGQCSFGIKAQAAQKLDLKKIEIEKSEEIESEFLPDADDVFQSSINKNSKLFNKGSKSAEKDKTPTPTVIVRYMIVYDNDPDEDELLVMASPWGGKYEEDLQLGMLFVSYKTGMELRSKILEYSHPSSSFLAEGVGDGLSITLDSTIPDRYSSYGGEGRGVLRGTNSQSQKHNRDREPNTNIFPFAVIAGILLVPCITAAFMIMYILIRRSFAIRPEDYVISGNDLDPDSKNNSVPTLTLHQVLTLPEVQYRGGNMAMAVINADKIDINVDNPMLRKQEDRNFHKDKVPIVSANITVDGVPNLPEREYCPQDVCELCTSSSIGKKKASTLSSMPLTQAKQPRPQNQHQGLFDQTTCSVCLDEYDVGEKVRVLPCKHFFHTDCIIPWLTERQGCCPMCKNPVYPSSHTDTT